MTGQASTEQAWRLGSQADWLLAAARDTIAKALDGDADASTQEEYAARAAALCQMAVEKCQARQAAELDERTS